MRFSGCLIVITVGCMFVLEIKYDDDDGDMLITNKRMHLHNVIYCSKHKMKVKMPICEFKQDLDDKFDIMTLYKYKVLRL